LEFLSPFFFEAIRPEIRQYLLESDNEAVPFSRAQRSLVYQRAKNVESRQPFGTGEDVYLAGYEWINHSLRPVQIDDFDFRVKIGGRHCKEPYSCSVFNISAMSFGALSANAVRALKPGHGGVLPGAKVTPEIAEARGIPIGKDCLSPEQHSAFATPLGLIEFISALRELSGDKPVGFKFSLGHPWEFFGICKAMLKTGITPDFIVVDCGEGGTGAAPIEFTDHIGTPLQEALLLVHNMLTGLNLRNEIRLGASGKIISAFDIARTMALGADWRNAARGFMFALGCIQSLSCHTGRCPTGVATQDPWPARAGAGGQGDARLQHAACACRTDRRRRASPSG
jgi:glutamate synthase domain-containing protein 2